MSQEIAQSMQSDLSPQQLAFVEYLANPGDHREQQEIASVLGVNESTLWRWKQDRRVQDAVWNLIIDKVRTDDLSAIWAGLLKQAKRGDTKATKLIFEVLGKYAPGPDIAIQNNMVVQVVSQVPEEQA